MIVEGYLFIWEGNISVIVFTEPNDIVILDMAFE